MKLTVLGTGTATPSLRRASSSYLLTCRWGQILVDIGPAVVRRLLESGYGINDVDMIILTHFHPDHTADLVTFLFASNYGVIERNKPLVLLAGKGLERFWRNLLKVYRWLEPNSYELTVKSMSHGLWSLGDLSIRTVPVNHNPESIAIKVDEGRSMVFSGDTGYSANLVRLAAGADLLVTECSFPGQKVKGHLNLEMLQRMVERSKPRQVLLSHLYPEWEHFGGVLHAPLLLAEDGMELEI